MKFIIYIATTLRHGQYPRLPEFQYCQKRDKYLFAGRELTMDEFNAAAARVFHPDYRTEGFQFAPLAIVDEPAVAPEPEPEPIQESETEPVESPRFRLEGTDIFEGDERVGGLFQPGPHLRVAHGKSALRPDLEAFLASLPQNDQ